MDYKEFLENKSQLIGNFGFDPIFIHDMAFDFQKYIIDWALRKGRAAIFADTGLGKTLIQLVIADNIVKKTNGNVLILTPLAVAFKFIEEAKNIDLDIEHSRDGKFKSKIVVTNYERLNKFDYKDFECVILDESSILKNFDGAFKAQITEFMKKIKYRFLSTATPSPNDFKEFILMQAKKHSLIESITNVIIGYFVALISQLLVFPIFNIDVSIKTNIYIGLWFTGISIIRSYILRRIFTRRTE